jgi:hypothetical protein
LSSKNPGEVKATLDAIVGPDAAATFRKASEFASAREVREEDSGAYEEAVADTRRAAVETTLNTLLGVKPKPVEKAAVGPIVMARSFLEELHDEFARVFGAPPSTAKARENWEDPQQAWLRCFDHVRVASVESAEGRDSDYVVVLETPRPRDLQDGLVKYKAKVSSAMKKAFGREVQLVPRMEAA